MQTVHAWEAEKPKDIIAHGWKLFCHHYHSQSTVRAGTTCAGHWDRTAELLPWRTHQGYTRSVEREHRQAIRQHSAQIHHWQFRFGAWAPFSFSELKHLPDTCLSITCSLRKAWANWRLENTEAPIPHWSLWTVATGRASPDLLPLQTWQHSMSEPWPLKEESASISFLPS